MNDMLSISHFVGLVQDLAVTVLTIKLDHLEREDRATSSLAVGDGTEADPESSRSTGKQLPRLPPEALRRGQTRTNCPGTVNVSA